MKDNKTDPQIRREILEVVKTKVAPQTYPIYFDSESGRYRLGPADLHCGDCFQIKVTGHGETPDRLKADVWLPVRIEHDNSGFFLIADFGIITRFGGATGRAV